MYPKSFGGKKNLVLRSTFSKVMYYLEIKYLFPFNVLDPRGQT